MYQELFDNLLTAVIVADETGHACYMNAASEDLFGMSQLRVIGQDLLWLYQSTTLSSTDVEKAKAQNARITVHDVTLKAHKKNLRCVISPFMTNHQQYLLLEWVDVEPEKSLLAKATQKTRQQLGHQMLKMLAHELKNPLAGILGAAQLLEQSYSNELVNLIKNEATRMDALVKKTVQSKPLSFKATNIHEPLEEALALLEVKSQGRFIFKRQYDPSLPSVLADKDALTQVFMNIGQNALDAMLSGGEIKVTSQVERGALPGKKAVSICIEDSGTGIAPEKISEIFYPYISGKKQGTGLGLAISEQIISGHHGLIAVESEPGKTVFKIILPSMVL